MDNFDWQCPVCLFSHLPSLAISSDNDSKSSDNDSSLNDHYPLPVDAFTPPFTNLRIVHQNVQGLLSKMTEISEWLYESFNLPLILCCSETWLLCADIVPSINGFKLYCSPLLSRPGKSNSLLPGSCVFVSATLSPEHPAVCDKVEQMCSLLNVACCTVICKHRRVAVVSVYRSPSVPGAACIAELRSILVLLSSNVDFILMAGDFNINLMVNNNTVTKEYIDLLADFQLTQHLSSPTRVSGSSATLIDHVISTITLSVSNIFQTAEITDHLMQVVDFSVSPSRSPSRLMWVRSFKKCDWPALRASLDSAPWHLMDLFHDLDDKWHFFHTVLGQVLDDFMPLHQVFSRRSKCPTPWFSDHISHLISSKNKARRRADKSANPTDQALYRRLKNHLKVQVRQAKLEHLDALVSRARRMPSRAAEVWSYVHAMFGHTQSRQPSQQDLGSLNSINDHFQSIAVGPGHQCANNFVIPKSDRIHLFLILFLFLKFCLIYYH